jgi:hypothetical protein
MTMSYLPRKTKKASLGDVVSSVTSALSTVTGAIGTAASAVNDPYLPETICHVRQMSELENGGRVVTTCAKTADGLRGGIGLRKFVKPLRAYVYAEQNPWVYPVAIGAAVGVPLLLGYLLGKD